MYSITRFEETGDQLFIRINHDEKPVYIEHFFTEEEKLDQQGTIEGLIAELLLKADDYIEPIQTVSKIEDAKAMKFDAKKIEAAKQKLKDNEKTID